MPPLLTLRNIRKTFEEKDGERIVALHDITLEVQEGEFFVFVGPSGCGKSTLLRIMSGLERQYEGEVQWSSGMTARDVGFVFQQFALLPWFTVSQNVELGLIARHVPEHERKRQVAAELKLLGLQEFAHVYPRELSGGMRQRVGIARAMATNPKIIFMDEPFSELDSFTARELREETLRIWKERHVTMVIVTHIIEEALELGTRIAVLTPHPGKIEKIVTNNLRRPRDSRSPEFFKIADELYKLIRP